MTGSHDDPMWDDFLTSGNTPHEGPWLHKVSSWSLQRYSPSYRPAEQKEPKDDPGVWKWFALANCWIKFDPNIGAWVTVAGSQYGPGPEKSILAELIIASEERLYRQLSEYLDGSPIEVEDDEDYDGHKDVHTIIHP